MKEKRKIGILTWYNHGNYGSALQAYALQTYLSRIGYDVEVIAYIMQWRRRDLSFKKRTKLWVKNTLAIIAEYLPAVFPLFINHFQYFYWRHIHFSPQCTENNIANVSFRYDTIITGSDQIWSPAHIDYTYLLNFCTRKNVRKVAYAPSFGLNYMPEDKIVEYKRLLSDYDAISVREDAGAKILKELGFDAEVVLDPTFLLDAEDYRRIEHSPKNIPPKFIFCYFLPTESDYSKHVLDYAKKTNLPVIGISLNDKDESWLNTIMNVGPLEFLWLIDHAEMVITNSYHGTIFSMILNTPFFTYKRFTSIDPINQNSRIEQLNIYFDISKYLVEQNIPKQSAYSFAQFKERLRALQKCAYEYLITNIK